MQSSATRDLATAPGHRPQPLAGRGLAHSDQINQSRPWRLRAILTDPNGLWWRPRLRGAARPPGRGLEPRATNLRVPNSVARRESPPTMPGFETAWTPGMAITAQTALAPLLTTGFGKAEAACYAKIVDKLH